MSRKLVLTLSVVTMFIIMTTTFLLKSNDGLLRETSQENSREWKHVEKKIDQSSALSPEIQKILSDPNAERRRFLR